MQSFQIFFIFRLVLWISSSLWLNVVSLSLFEVMLVIWQGSKEINILHLFQNQTLKSITLCSGQNCSAVLISSYTHHSSKSTKLHYVCFGNPSMNIGATNEWSETQVEVAALWSVGSACIFIFITLTCFHCWVSLTSCIYHSNAHWRPSVCFYLKSLFVFPKIRQYFSKESS